MQEYAEICRNMQKSLEAFRNVQKSAAICINCNQNINLHKYAEIC